MFDRKEAIHLQMLSSLEGVAGIESVWRDRGNLPPEEKCPCIIALDGNEELVHSYGGSSAEGIAGGLYRMKPQTWLILKPSKKNTNEGQGELLAAFRMKIVKKLYEDQVLISLLGQEGSITYMGNTTDMQSGSFLEGQENLLFDLVYNFNPAEL